MAALVPEGSLRERWKGVLYKSMEWQDKGDGFTLKEGRFRLNITNEFFTVRMARHWNRFPGDMDAPSLAVFKTRLGEALL